MNRFVFVLTAVLAPVLALVTSPALAQDDPASVINAFFDARSGGDATAALELFAEDAVYDGVGLCGGVSGAPPCVGKSAIAPEIERLISGSRPTVSGTEVSGNVVTVRYEVRGAGPQAAGVERIINVVTADVVVVHCSLRRLSDRPSGSAARQLGHVPTKRLGREFEPLAHGQVRGKRIGEVLHSQVEAHGEHPRVDDIASVFGDDVHAQHLFRVRVGDYLEDAPLVAVDQRARHRVQWQAA